MMVCDMRFPCTYRRKRPGFLLVEILLGVVLLGMFLSGLGATLLYGQESTVNGGDRARGAYFTERALQAVRSMRDSSFASLTTGVHGITLNGSQDWVYSGVNTIGSGGYVTSVVVGANPADPLNSLIVTGSTVWQHGYNRMGSVQMTTEVTNWRQTKPVGDWTAAPTLESSYDEIIPVNYSAIAVAGNYAYVAADIDPAVKILSITGTGPYALASAGGLNFGGVRVLDIVIRGKRMYVLSEIELRVYNISNPTAPTIVTSYDLSGGGGDRARRLALGRNFLYVTAVNGGPIAQVNAFDISNSGALTLGNTMTDNPHNFFGIAISGTGAYIASGDNNGEMKMVKAGYAGTLASTPVNYNIGNPGGNNDALSIAVSGTAALLGRLKVGNTSQNTIAFFNLGTTPATMYVLNGSGTVTGTAIDPNRCYGFVSALSGRRALQIINIRQPLPQLTFYDTTGPLYGRGRNIFYDLVRDRIFLLTEQRVLLLAPTGVSTCL